ncbi:HEPN domain-containing protein [Aquirhabdus sp.]|uniref:HEPN domain-containing protein n=1 Tax=Aquirhabdus sp. TaxID=2824160 RepID=UPI00396CE974
MVQHNELEAVQKLYIDHQDYYKFLMENGQISFANDYLSQFSKIFLLAAASYFEGSLLRAIHGMVNPSKCVLTTDFIDNKALKRQYHTLFDWATPSASGFFSLFGVGFKDFMKAKIRNDANLKESINSFLEIGSLRNQLVHNNFATFALQATASEIFIKFNDANLFVQQLPIFAMQYLVEFVSEGSLKT